MWEIGRFKLFLHRGINTVHKLLCTHNAVCVHVTFTVVSVHAICEGLVWNQEDPVSYPPSAHASFGNLTSLGSCNNYVNNCLLNFHPFLFNAEEEYPYIS